MTERIRIRWFVRDDGQIAVGLRLGQPPEPEAAYTEGDKVRLHGGKTSVRDRTPFERAFNYTQTVELSRRYLNLLALLSIARTHADRLAAFGLSPPDSAGALPLVDVARFGFEAHAGGANALYKRIRSHFQKGNQKLDKQEVVRIAGDPWCVSLAIAPGDITFDDGALDALCARLGGGGPPMEDALETYLVELEKEVGTIDIRGLGRGIGALQADITDLYTPLLTQARGDLDAGRDQGASGQARAGYVNLAGMLRSHPQLLIEGASGSGKTTFQRLVACALARDLQGRPSDSGSTWRADHLGLSGAEPAEVPIFMKLSVVADMLSGATAGPADPKALLLATLERRTLEMGCPVSAEGFQRVLSRRNVVFLFDGLDEVTDDALREKVFKILDRVRREWPRARVVVTSRPFDTERLQSMGFAVARVEPLDGEGIRAFLDHWVASFQSAPRGYRETLDGAIGGSPIIRELAQNPMMLTCLCVLHWNDFELPHGRAGVYEAILAWLLKARRAQREKERFPQAFAEYAFPALAYSMMTGPEKKVVIDVADAADIVEAEAIGRYGAEFGHGAQSARRLREWLRWECLWSGILEEVGRGRVRFRHLTFQEYYAAAQLAQLKQDPNGEGAWWPIVEPRLADAQWRETVDMFPACLLKDGPKRVDLLLDRVLGLGGDAPSLADDARAVGVVGRLLVHLDVSTYGYRPTVAIKNRHARAVERVMPIFTKAGAAKVPWQERLAVAEALGRAGDPRLHDPPRKRMLPVGLQGSGRPVLLGKYPVTVEEYRHFVGQRGYEERRYWVGEDREEGWEVRDRERWEGPGGWMHQLTAPNRPVVGVSWYEAVAYCAWLAEQTGEAFRLPKEAEWQAAATRRDFSILLVGEGDRQLRGGPGGAYPWGNAKPTPELANFRDSGVYSATSVGIYPAGAAVNGHLDMAGNVWEWCVDRVSRQRQVSPPEHPPGRTLRGGGCRSGGDPLRSAVCVGSYADHRADDVGLRLALTLASLSP